MVQNTDLQLKPTRSVVIHNRILQPGYIVCESICPGKCVKQKVFDAYDTLCIVLGASSMVITRTMLDDSELNLTAST